MTGVAERMRAAAHEAERAARVSYVHLLRRHDDLDDQDVVELQAVCEVLGQAVEQFDRDVEVLRKIAELDSRGANDGLHRQTLKQLKANERRTRAAVPSPVVDGAARKKLEHEVRQVRREINKHQNALQITATAKAEAGRLKADAWWWNAFEGVTE